MHAYKAAIFKVEQYLAKCSENPVYALAVSTYSPHNLQYLLRWLYSTETSHKTQLHMRKLDDGAIHTGPYINSHRGNVYYSVLDSNSNLFGR
jgi:hypothetical protein